MFIHPPSSTNGSNPPRVPKIGELEAWVREPPAQSSWRDEFYSLGMSIITTPDRVPPTVMGPPSSNSTVNWVGEVVHVSGDQYLIASVLLIPARAAAPYGPDRRSCPGWDDCHRAYQQALRLARLC